MQCSARQPGRARRQLAPFPWRGAGAASALLTAALTVSLDAWAQTEAAPADPSATPTSQEAEADTAPEPPPAPPSEPRAPKPRLGDIVLPAARPESKPDDDTSLDQLAPWDEGRFLYPYPPAQKLRPPEPEPPRARRRIRKRKMERRWYGWQTLIADAMTVAAFYLAEEEVHDDTLRTPLLETGVFGYLIGPPIVHWANGQAGKGFSSLAIRGGSAASVAVGIPGCVSANDDGRCLLALTGMIGLVAAIPIDAAVLARKDVPLEARKRARIEFELASITPVVDLAHRWMGLRAGGRF